MKFYYDILSQPSRALYIFMKLNKIPFEAVVIKLGRDQNLKEKFKEVNRFQKVPCIDDNGFKLAESVAIFRYIVDSNPTIANHWYPKNLQERAKVDEYLEWQHLNTRAGCGGFFWAAYGEPLMRWKAPSVYRMEAVKEIMDKALNSLESVWLSDESKPFLATKEISFADLLAACELENAKITDYDPFAGRPNLTTWHKLVKEQTNPIYDEAHSTTYKLFGTMDKSRFYKMWKLFFSYLLKK